MNKREIKEIKSDLAYWQAFAERIGATVIGWTYREGCTLNVGGQSLHITGWQRDHIMRSLANPKRVDSEEGG